jgi:hypothetical protein
MVLLGQWVRCGCGEHARIRCEEAVVHRSGMAARKDQCVNPNRQPQPPTASHQPPTQADNTDTDTYTYVYMPARGRCKHTPRMRAWCILRWRRYRHHAPICGLRCSAYCPANSWAQMPAPVPVNSSTQIAKSKRSTHVCAGTVQTATSSKWGNRGRIHYRRALRRSTRSCT